MARVRSIHRMKARATAHPTEVDCGYQIVDGGRLLQLSTFGSDSRQSQPKVSQTLQFDREKAAELMEIIRATFPGL